MLTGSQNHTVAIGDTLNLTCSFDIKNYDPWKLTPIWLKTQLYESKNISKTKEPEEPFKSTARFTVILEYDTDPIVFLLIIKGNNY